MLLGQGSEAGQEALDPLLPFASPEQARRKSEGEEGGQRASSHGRQIAEASGEATVTYGSGGMKVAAEVAVLETEVGGDENLISTRRTKDGAVVANAEGEAFVPPAGEGAADLFDQGRLSLRLSRHSYGIPPSRLNCAKSSK